MRFYLKVRVQEELGVSCLADSHTFPSKRGEDASVSQIPRKKNEPLFIVFDELSTDRDVPLVEGSWNVLEEKVVVIIVF